MSDFAGTVEHSAGRKLGPLPVWGWGLVLGLVLVFVIWHRSRSTSGTNAPGSINTGVDPNAFDNAALYSGNNANASNATAATASTEAGLRSNAAWLRAGVQYETGKGRNSLNVLRALRRFLAGSPLSQAQSDIVSDVLKNVGVPPKEPKTVSPVRKPAHTEDHTTPGTKPPAVRASGMVAKTPVNDLEIIPRQALTSIPPHVVTTAEPGDTPASVAQQVYGVSTPRHINAIVSANQIGSTQEFVPGQIVRVPVVR